MEKRTRIGVVLGVVAAALAIGSVGADAADAVAVGPLASVYAPLVQSLSHHQMTLAKTLSSGIPGLTVLVAHNKQGQPNLAFGLDGKYLIPGPIIAANGQAINGAMAIKAGLVKKPIPISQLVNRVTAAKGFVLGHSGPMLAVFMDPNCIFCHKFYEDMQPELAAGKVRLKVLPVAFLKPSSLPKAVAILSAKDPGIAWAVNEAEFNSKAEEGGIKPAKNIHVPALGAIVANSRLLASTGEVATPTVVACNKAGHPVMWHGVTPADLAKIKSGNIGDLLPTGTCHS